MRFVLALLLIVIAPATAWAERRVALVFGADDYRLIRRLDNGVNDARAMEAALEKLGFEVVLEPDRDLKRMRRALDDFREDAAGADVALVFFAGHGVEIGGENRLLPVDADATSLTSLEASSLPLEDVRAAVAAVAKVGLIVLDACRNDPFGQGGGTGRGATSLGRDVTANVRPGLGRVGRAENMLFAFAAAPGETAADGAGGNSPFTTALAKYFGTDGLEIRSVLTLVQQEVYDLSRGKQLPYVESGLPDVFFAAAAKDQLPERERLLLAMADITPELRGKVERIASDAGMPLAPLYGALVDLDRNSLSADQLDARLREAAQSFAKVQSEMKTLASTDPEVTGLRQAAEEQLALGAFDAARDELAKAAALDNRSRQSLKANFTERTLSEAATYVLRGGAARTELSYAMAIEDYGKAEALFEEAGEDAIEGEHADRRLLALSELGDLYTSVGDIASAAGAYQALVTWAEQLAARDSGSRRRRDVAKSHGKLGDARVTLGDLTGALAEYGRAKTVLEDMASGRLQPELQRDLAIVNDDMAEVYSRQGNIAAAEDALRASLTYKQDLAQRYPEDLTGKRDLTVTLDALGDIWRTTGKTAAAKDAFEASLETRLALAAVDPASAGRQRDVSVSYDNIGDVQRELGNPQEALSAYRKSLDVVIELAKASPEDTQYQRDISVSANKIGNVQRDMGDLEGALASYRDALAITERQARSDGNNSEWQRDWSVTTEKVADILRRNGDRAGALAMYEDSHDIMSALLQRDPANTDWQRDVSITLAEMGNLRLHLRDVDGAREALARCLEMRRQLAAREPNNALWQRDLVIAQVDFAQVAENPRAVLTQALDLALELQRTGRLPPKEDRLADYVRARLAKARK